MSPRLLAELARALSYPKVRERVDAGGAIGLVELFGTVAVMAAISALRRSRPVTPTMTT